MRRHLVIFAVLALGGTAVAEVRPLPARRLSPVEYLNSVHDLFPKVNLDGPPALQISLGGDGPPSPLLVEQYQIAAERVGAAVSSHLDDVVDCPSDGRDAVCGRKLVRGLARRAFRRPLTALEATQLDGFFEKTRAAEGFAAAVDLSVRALLQSPQFLYRLELGAPGAPGQGTPLTGYELAARLSYFLWESLPDEPLLQAAAGGVLDREAGVEAQARRLLADARAHRAMTDFHHRWLGLDRIAVVSPDPTLFPRYAVRGVPWAIKQSTDRWLQHWFWEGDARLSTLLTDNHAFVNDGLAPIYGVAPPRTDELTLVALDGKQRAGILTQAGMLAALAHSTIESPILRGVYVLRTFLCAPPSPPPPSANTKLLENLKGDAQTTRERIKNEHSGAACESCHDRIDGIGFGFEAYDALGQFRSVENGRPVDASGWLDEIGDLRGPFNGAVELAHKLAASRRVQECVVTQHLRAALGREVGDADHGTVVELANQLEHSGGDLRELLVQVVRSRAFRYRSWP